MPLNFFYTTVQKSQKWPKTQIKGGPALRVRSDCDQDGRPCDQATMRLWPSRSHCDHDSAWPWLWAGFPRIWQSFSKFSGSFLLASLFPNTTVTIGGVCTCCFWKSGEIGHDKLGNYKHKHASPQFTPHHRLTSPEPWGSFLSQFCMEVDSSQRQNENGFFGRHGAKVYRGVAPHHQ